MEVADPAFGDTLVVAPTSQNGQSARVLNFEGTPDDTSGYLKLRVFLTSASEQLEALGVPTADQMKTAANWVGSPSEWLGESALAIKATLAARGVPAGLEEDLRSALDTIREGFRRIGTEPIF